MLNYLQLSSIANNYEAKVYPVFMLAIVGEFLLRLKTVSYMRTSETIFNLISGLLLILIRSLMLKLFSTCCQWLNTNYVLVNLTESTAQSSLIGYYSMIICTFIMVDFLFYWCHRAGHEINVFWATHQFHHSGEDYNLSVASRTLATEANYVLLAFATVWLSVLIPGPTLIHVLEFIIVYQFTLHTSLWKSYGWLDLVMIAPGDHSVHHGSNEYCLDRNYGSVLSVWDRWFGTYVRERPDEPVVYGLVHKPPVTYDFTRQSVYYFGLIYEKFSTNYPGQPTSLSNKWHSLFNKPSWSMPYIDNNNIDQVDMDDKIKQHNFEFNKLYNLNYRMHWYMYLYITVHLLMISMDIFMVLNGRESMNIKLIMVKYLWTYLFLTSIGAILDNKTYAPIIELARLLIYYYYPMNNYYQLSIEQIYN
ncbi:alkylglycerol monooxygenase-like [Oppia nitens]|uniref:alkylglycerol monooxygenase-like n=1 Tax=Oppia nitens TaxID=1686743 RepID=UPI0023DA46AC|nr:alkylglycerol monooxygenase-like [Oppia nitens]